MHIKHSVLLGLLALGTHGTAQTLIETVNTVGIQNTLNQTQNSAVNPGQTIEKAKEAAQNLKVQYDLCSISPDFCPTPASAASAKPAAPATPTKLPELKVTPLSEAQQALLSRAQAAFQGGDYPQARSLFEALIAQNYTSPESHFGLALTLFALKNDKGAAFEFIQFAQLAPERFEGPYNLGVIASRAGNHEQALKLYEQANALMKDQATPAAQRQVLEALSAAQTRKGDFAALSETLAAMSALHPEDQNLQYRLAQARTLSGQGAAALPGVYALLQKEPARLDAALLLADIYVAQGLNDRAARELDAAVSRVKNGSERATLLLRKARILADAGDTRAAVFAAQDATREDGRNAEAFALAGKLRLQRNDRPGALNAYLNAVKLAPTSAAYRAELGGVRLVMGRYAEAANDAALALKLRPDETTLARALFIQGVAAYHQKNYAQAQAALQSSLTRSPTADTALWLGLSAYARADYAAASSALDQSVKLNPTPTARLNLASALLASGRYAEAEAILRGLVADNPKNAEAYYLLGLAQRAQQRPDDARISLQTAANLGNMKAKEALK